MLRRFALAASLLLLVSVVTPVSEAASPKTVTPVFPGLDRLQITFDLDDGRLARATVLRFDQDDPSLELRPVLARDAVPGVETVPSMGKRLLDDGGVAGINAGFWLNSPVGDPNGFFASGGHLVSEPETQGGSPRGTLARAADGTYLMDRVDADLLLSVNDEPEPFTVTALNRFYRSAPPFPDDTISPLYVYSPEFGATVTVSELEVPDPDAEPEPDPEPSPEADPDAEQEPAEPEPKTKRLPVHAVTVAGLHPAASGWASGQITASDSGPGVRTIPADGSVVVGHGGAADRLEGLAIGSTVRLNSTLVPQGDPAQHWEDIVEGVAAGPLIVRDGQRTDPSTWEAEGFAPATHSNVRHPRSAIALTRDGQILLVAVDGRQPGYSAGMTMHELAHFLRTLGAVHALSLDGGGSSQLVTDGVLRNRTCCDRNLRPVGTGLFVFHHYRFPASQRIAGEGREDTAARIAAASHPDGAEEVVLAAGGNFPDALAGGPLARAVDGPLLLTNPAVLPAATAAALDRMQPERVTVLGGDGVVHQELLERLGDRYTIRRLAGRDRIETAVSVAEAMGDYHPRVFLASAGRFPDALSAAAAAGMLGMPILLTWPDALPEATRDALEQFETGEVIIVGGDGVVAEPVVTELDDDGLEITRLAGPSRYATANAIAEWSRGQIEDLDDQEVLVASGEAFPDALAGGPLAAQRRQLLALVPPTELDANPDAAAGLRALEGIVKRATLLGGHAALSSYVHWELDQIATRAAP